MSVTSKKLIILWKVLAITVFSYLAILSTTSINIVPPSYKINEDIRKHSFWDKSIIGILKITKHTTRKYLLKILKSVGRG